ncbi:hypothetical protein ACTSKR_05310 [Chitinibacteraceae bacterium HSL-7]
MNWHMLFHASAAVLCLCAIVLSIPVSLLNHELNTLFVASAAVSGSIAAIASWKLASLNKARKVHDANHLLAPRIDDPRHTAESTHTDEND